MKPTLTFLPLTSLTLFLLSQVGVQAFPIAPLLMIGSGARSGAPDAVCQVLTWNEDGKVLATCSATLITADSALTAAHCFEGAVRSATVQCGYPEQKPTLSPRSHGGDALAMVDGVEFRENHGAARVRVPQPYRQGESHDDLAVITLDQLSRLKPIGIAGETERAALIAADGSLVPGAECRSAGFGISDGGRLLGLAYNARIPALKQETGGWSRIESSPVRDRAQSRRCEIAAYNDSRNPSAETLLEELKAWNATGVFAEMLAPGDSGGPLYCRRSGEQDWKLLGVTRSIRLDFKGGASAGDPDTISHTERWTAPDSSQHEQWRYVL